MGDKEKLMVLRVQLYTAAQMLKGDSLRALKELIAEIVTVVDFELKRADAKVGGG